MSKIGKQIIDLEEQVEVKIDGRKVLVKGPKGSLELNIPRGVDVLAEGGKLKVSIKKTTRQNRSNWGTIKSLISNMVRGVVDGWSRQLELVGTGYRAEVKGDTLVLTIGYSHPVEIKAPSGITFKVEKNIVTVEGIDKGVVGQVVANVRAVRPPEPYKGKGIKYIDEVIRRKAGKAAKTAVT